MMVPLVESIEFGKNIATLSTKLMNVSDRICLVLHSILQNIYSLNHSTCLICLQVLLEPCMMI